MARNPERRQTGFTLLEILIVLAIIGIFWGVGVKVMPRMLSGSGPDSFGRLLAGAGQDTRQMAMLQQRPWELLLDLDRGVFYRGPLGAVRKRELRASGLLLDDEFRDPDEEREEEIYLSHTVRRGERTEQDLITRRREELENQPTDTLRVARRYDQLAFNYEDTSSDIVSSILPEDVRIIQIWKQGGYAEAEGRISLVFGPRGFVLPTAVWLEDAKVPGKNRYTVYFSGIMSPMVVAGTHLPNEDGELRAVDIL